MVICNSHDGETMLLGLSYQNLDRLRRGQPIRLSRDSHGAAMPENLTILIVADVTEDKIVAELRKLGLIRDETVVTKHRGLPK